MSETDSYAVHERSKVHRYAERARYDYANVHGILRATPLWHVAFVPSAEDPFPTILPMIGAVGSYLSSEASFEDEAMDLYLHGAAAARLLKMAPSANGSEATLPLSISATLVDGYILALTPMHHSMNYRSAVVHGHASIVTSPEERLWAMELVTNSTIPQRWQNTRVPPTKAELNQTGILKVKIASASAKVRAGGPGEDKRDERDASVRDRVWTGVLPVWTQFGDLVPADGNVVEDVPAYLDNWVQRTNANAKGKAERAIHG